MRSSPFDLWAVSETTALVKDAGKPFVFVVIQAKQQATITAQAVAALSEHGGVAQAFISDRVAYAAAMTGGNTAPELATKGPAAQEIEALWAEIKGRFNESSNRQNQQKRSQMAKTQALDGNELGLAKPRTQSAPRQLGVVPSAVNGKAEVVVQDATSYQAMLDHLQNRACSERELNQLRESFGIRRGELRFGFRDHPIRAIDDEKTLVS